MVSERPRPAPEGAASSLQRELANLVAAGALRRRTDGNRVYPALKNAEGRLLRPVNASVSTAGEVAAKLDAGHHFLGTVMAGAKLFIVGDEDDLNMLLNPLRP